MGYKSLRGFIESEIKREISENIMMNRAIEGIEDFETSLEGDMLQVSFTVILKK